MWASSSLLFWRSLWKEGVRVSILCQSDRAIHPNKRGKIADRQPKILQRLQIEPAALLLFLSRKDRFHHVIGSKTSIRKATIKLGKRFLQGIAAAERLFPQRI